MNSVSRNIVSVKTGFEKMKKKKYYVIFDIRNSNFGTLANQHICYQGHKSMRFTRKFFNSPWFLAKLESPGAPKTFSIRNKPKKVKLKLILLQYMFPPQILMMVWWIITAADATSIKLLHHYPIVSRTSNGCVLWNGFYNGLISKFNLEKIIFA